jgi:hypothetical protein
MDSTRLRPKSRSSLATQDDKERQLQLEVEVEGLGDHTPQHGRIVRFCLDFRKLGVLLALALLYFLFIVSLNESAPS